MCEPKPGARCAADTRDTAVATLERYECTHVDGPCVEPLTSAMAMFEDERAANAAAEAFATSFGYLDDAQGDGGAELDRAPVLSFEQAQAFLANASADARARVREESPAVSAASQRFHEWRGRAEQNFASARAALDAEVANPPRFGVRQSTIDAVGLATTNLADAKAFSGMSHAQFSALTPAQVAERRIEHGVRAITGRVGRYAEFTTTDAKAAPVGTAVDADDDYTFYKVGENSWHASWTSDRGSAAIYRPDLADVEGRISDVDVERRRDEHNESYKHRLDILH